MKKFEYKTIPVYATSWNRDKNTDEELNSLGKEGWELVTAATIDDDGDSNTWYTFKREI